MSSASVAASPGLLGQTVVIIGGGSGIGLATARRAKSEGAQLVITDRRSGPLEEVADDIGVEAIAVFDDSDVGQLEAFLGRLPGYVDHVMLNGGTPYVARLSEIDLLRARDAVEQLLLPICIGRYAQREMRDGGSLVFIGGTRARRPGPGQAVAAIAAGALPVMVANLATETAPVRVNLIACAGHPAGPDDVAELAVRLMTDPAMNGAIIEMDGEASRGTLRADVDVS